MLNLTNNEINTLIDNALTETNDREAIAAMFVNNDFRSSMTDVSVSDAYAAPAVTADDICTAMKLSCM